MCACIFLTAKEWRPLPKELIQGEVIAEADMDQGETVDDNDPRVGEYHHPTRGVFATYLFENTRNTRLYFDETLGQWARMPLAWERNVDEVKQMLEEIDRMFPDWKNVKEQVGFSLSRLIDPPQLLALRECNYDLAVRHIFCIFLFCIF